MSFRDTAAPQETATKDWLPLHAAVNMVAFGTTEQPCNNDLWTTREQQHTAFQDLCRAANESRVKLHGFCTKSKNWLDIPQQVFAHKLVFVGLFSEPKENDIIDLHSETTKEWNRMREGIKHELRWTNVTVERDSLVAWRNTVNASSTMGGELPSGDRVDGASALTRVANEEPQADKSGGQSFSDTDAPLVEEMREMLVRGNAKSVQDAARQLAPRAKALGKTESVVERLRRAYGRKYPTRRRS